MPTLSLTTIKSLVLAQLISPCTRCLLPTESWNLPRQETFGVDRNQEVGYEACFYVDYEGKLVRVESATCGYTEHPDSTHPYGKYKAPQFP